MLVSPGQKLDIPAAVWNALTDMLGRWTRSRFDQLAAELVTTYPPSVVWVKNTTSTNRSAFEILTISDTIADVRTYTNEKYKSLHLDGGTVTNNSLYSYCVLQEPARANGGFARAVIDGATLVKLNIIHAADKYCDVSDGVSSYLRTGALGTSRIILKHEGTGSDNKWGVIRVGHHSGQILIYNAGTEISAGSSGTATVYGGSTGAEASTGQTLTVKNRSSMAWGANKFGSAELIDGVAYMSPLQTP